MRIIAFALLCLPLAAQAGFQKVPKHGSYGTVLIEAKDAAGAWNEAGRLKYDFHYKGQTVSLPAASAPGGELRVRFVDNDENQLDAVTLAQAGRKLPLREARESVTGKDMKAKLAFPDRDIVEVGHDPVLVRFEAPKAAGDLSFTLHARSARQNEFLGYPFWVRDETPQAQVPFRLEPAEGKRLTIHSAVLKSSSGHPSAPIMGEFKIEGGRLKGSVDFGPDNDPGPDDYVTLLARDEKLQPHEFKVGMRPGPYGHQDYIYGPAARWQYMRFHFDVPVAELPRMEGGQLGLELLAYGTSCGNLDNDAKSFSFSHLPASPAGGDWVTGTVTVSESSGVYANVPHYISTTCVVVDGGGNTVFNQTQSYLLGSCGSGAASFLFKPECPGAYVVYYKSIGNPDYDPTNGAISDSFTVAGSCATATPTSTVTETPTSTCTVTETNTSTITETYTETPSSTVTATWSSTRTVTETATQSATQTPTPSTTPTSTVTQTLTGPEIASTATQVAVAQTLTATNQPFLNRSNTGVTLVGPVPAKAGQPLCIYFSDNNFDGDIELYNLAGDRIARQAFTGGGSCFKTTSWAPGIYGAHVKVGGKDRWQKVVIVP